MAESSRNTKTEQRYRQYNPYQDLNIPIRNLYNLPTSPELLFQEEAAKNRRSWGENLQFYTGIGFLSGATLGALHGSYKGILAAEAGETLKLRLNRVLNSGGQKGGKFGNSLGIVGLIFSGLESGLVYLRGSDDVLNTILAGLGTGAIYRAASGPRSAAIAGAIGGITAAAAVAGKHMAKRYVPI
ncbi:Mitochondrial inner membrane translocase subunit Tim17/Tim22/Tim23/peroxisomal protein PMP24 [Corchorus olitorius]|uniref:Mitochondrial inner membrane translocase subunit Tim17/Tim22/Tim23/peroxisomal protein PMP24 n=1 Tax=Corchorus olitorius TaxID=93759 RepID=A0A1R3JNN2_9ROSI|nr:Mitochondrial inner membrane translocase subunit Tim17/Tim22/Tim23/peroxisomal protein PMP24 [Corchorus olitorius]